MCGAIDQVPPMYSAVRHRGKRLYELARAGKEVERAARRVHIHSLDIVRWEPPELEFSVHCSKGTYIRVLAEGLAERLDTCAHLTTLRRTGIDGFEGLESVSLDDLEDAASRNEHLSLLLPFDTGLRHLPSVAVGEAQRPAIEHGNPVRLDAMPAGEASEARTVVIRTAGGDALAVGELTPDGMLRPRRVFVTGSA
jgi:tRNA pseudouridine55 synthase